MTAAEYQSLASTAAQEITLIEGTTEQALLRGIVAAAEAFDYAAPLPPMPGYRGRSWEPAARHYRDLTTDEKEMNA